LLPNVTVISLLVRRGSIGQACGKGFLRIELDRSFLFGSPLSSAQQIHRTIRRNAIQPRAKPCARLESAQVLVGAQEGLLHEILRVLFIAGHTKSQLEEPDAVALNEQTKGVL